MSISGSDKIKTNDDNDDESKAEPIHIINIAIKPEGADDENLSKKCESFCQTRVSLKFIHPILDCHSILITNH